MSNKKREKLARFGIGTKGFVYCLLSGLTLMAVIGWGGEKMGKDGVLQYLAEQQFGNILLWLTAIGLFAFSLWRLYRSFLEQHDDDSTGKEIIRRVAYSLSAIFYGSLGYTAIKIASSANSGGNSESWISRVLAVSYGKVLLVIIALLLFGKAVYEVYRAYSDKYRDQLSKQGIGSDIRDLLIQSGKVGHTARGVVIGVISYLTIRAALTAGDGGDASTASAFTFLQDNFGPLFLGLITTGLFCYGIFQFVRARYEPLSI